MSIPNLLNKIKGFTGIDNTTFMYLIIVVFVGLGSFSLGRLSTAGYSKDIDSGDSVQILNTNTSNISSNNELKVTDSQNSDISTVNKIEGMYVASKNGKIYYSPSCSGAKRIADKNKIWFNSTSEAEKLGYHQSSSCKY